jgi:hypothetical protein
MKIDFRLGSTVQVLTGIAVLPALPIYFVYFQEIKNYTMTKNQQTTACRVGSHWHYGWPLFLVRYFMENCMIYLWLFCR